jgi:hypothetical protein
VLVKCFRELQIIDEQGNAFNALHTLTHAHAHVSAAAIHSAVVSFHEAIVVTTTFDRQRDPAVRPAKMARIRPGRRSHFALSSRTHL